MPMEAMWLQGAPLPFDRCPKCGCLFEPFLRGQVQRLPVRWWWPFKLRDYCALICRSCKEIVGYERPSEKS